MRKAYRRLVVAALALSAVAFSAVASGQTGKSTLKDPGSRTVGLIQSFGGSEQLAVWTAQLRATFEPLGWKVSVCDGAGNVATMQGCMESFVTRKVDAIVTFALGGPEIEKGIKLAKDAGIPVIAQGLDVFPGYGKKFDAVFADSPVAAGKFTARWLAKNAKGATIVGEEITQNYGGQGYVNGVKAEFKKLGLKYADLRDTDLANIVNSMSKNAEAILQKNSGKLYFVDFSDFGFNVYGPSIKRAGRSGDVTVITRYDNPSTVKAVKGGANLLISTTRNWRHFFDLANALLDHWVDGKPLSKGSVYEPGIVIVGAKEFAGKNRAYPFPPGLKKQLAVWAKTYNLKPSTLTAP